MPLTFEDLTRATHDEVKALILEGLAEHWGHVDESLNPDLEDMLTSYSSGRTIVARNNRGEIVGTGTVLRRPEARAEVMRMSVRHNARRLGVGAQLVGELVATARKLSRHEPHNAETEKGFRDLSLKELTEFVFSEIHAGVLGSATGPHVKESFPVLSQGPLVAAIWAVVARLRRVAAEGSQGKIRFLPTTHGPIGMMALDEAERVLDPTSTSVVDETDIAALHGLNAIVIDDDLDIRAVFKKVLSVAGINVTVASNGKEGLTAIEQAPPDIIITDILMPEMDGWELATRLKWDFALKHIPIIMLSWKEDFLQRVRELNVEANGYMLKEMDRQQILSRVAGVLKPRFSLEQRLAEEGETTGRIERIGVVGILQAAMVARPNCRITIRENWNYFEADILDGSLVSVNRTGTDGSFASGIPALERLLGVSSGRFSIVNRVEISKQQFQDGSMTMIRSACRRLNELNNHVVDGNLINIRELILNQDVIDIYSRVMPHKLKTALSRIADGESPRSILLSGSTSSETLETLLLDLIRMGAVKEIVDIEPESKRRQKSAGISTSALISSATKEKIDIEQEQSGDRATSLTIQLSDKDIDEIANAPEKGLLPFLADQGSHARSTVRLWQAISAFCFLGLIVTTILLLTTQNRSPVEEAIVSETRPEISVEDNTDSPSTKKASVLTASAAGQKTITTRQEETAATPEALSHPRKVMASDERTPKTTAAPTPVAAKKEPKPKTTPKKPAKASTSQGTTREKGLLSIGLPPGAKPNTIRISVDGRLRGKVPIKIRLSAGIHEIVYSLDGKRVMRMVRVNAGQTKEVTAKQPQ